MNQQPAIVPYRIGQKIRPLGCVESYLILAIYWCAGNWRVEIEIGGHQYGFWIDQVEPDDPKSYSITKIYATKTGKALGLIEGGRK